MKLTIVIFFCLTILTACATGSSSVTQDTMLADQGYLELLKGNYERAEANFEVALSINPHNPYALLNMGVLYQNTGRLKNARELYQRLIDLNTDVVAAESFSSSFEGKKLVDIAKENLSAIGLD